jgi:uncharacterized membrane protein
MMTRPRTDREIAQELDELRLRLQASQREEKQRREQIEQLRLDLAKISAELRRLRGEPD